MMMTLAGGGGAAASADGGGGAMKAALRHAMLQHEVVFRNQVRELHRLYWTQKNLMTEMCRAAGEAALASAPACSQTVETGVCDGGVRQEKQREMMLDLRLPADEYIRGGGVPVPTGSETGTIDLVSFNGGQKGSSYPLSPYMFTVIMKFVAGLVIGNGSCNRQWIKGQRVHEDIK